MCVCACISLQFCDKAIAEYYPDLFNKAEEAKGTVINALIITSDSVAVIKAESTTWTVTMDRSMVRECSYAVVAIAIFYPLDFEV